MPLKSVGWQIASVETDVQSALHKSDNAISASEAETLACETVRKAVESLDKKAKDSFNNMKEDVDALRSRIYKLADGDKVDTLDSRIEQIETRFDNNAQSVGTRLQSCERALQEMEKMLSNKASTMDEMHQRITSLQEEHRKAENTRSTEMANMNEALRLQWDESMKGLEAAADGVGAACDRANQAIEGIHQVGRLVKLLLGCSIDFSIHFQHPTAELFFFF